MPNGKIGRFLSDLHNPKHPADYVATVLRHNLKAGFI
jgi:hypothetical protein